MASRCFLACGCGLPFVWLCSWPSGSNSTILFGPASPRQSADFDMLHGRTSDHLAVACAFDLLMHDGDDLRRRPFRERKLALGKLLIRSRGGMQYVEHTEGHGKKLFEAVCDLGLEGIVSKRLTSVYKS